MSIGLRITHNFYGCKGISSELSEFYINPDSSNNSPNKCLLDLFYVQELHLALIIILLLYMLKFISHSSVNNKLYKQKFKKQA